MIVTSVTFYENNKFYTYLHACELKYLAINIVRQVVTIKVYSLCNQYPKWASVTDWGHS